MIVVAKQGGPYRIKDLQLVETTPPTCTFDIHCDPGLPQPEIGSWIRIVGDDRAFEARIVHVRMRAGRGRAYCRIEHELDLSSLIDKPEPSRDPVAPAEHNGRDE